MKRWIISNAFTLLIGVTVFITCSLFTVFYRQDNNDTTDKPPVGITSLLQENTADNPNAYILCALPAVFMPNISVGIPFVHAQYQPNSCERWNYQTSSTALYLDLIVAFCVGIITSMAFYRLFKKRAT